MPEGEPSVEVKLGTAEQVRLVPGEMPKLLIDKGLKNSLTTEITLSEPVTAPVSPGQQLGRLTVRAGDQILSQVPLVAETEVPRLSWGQLFSLVMKEISMGN